MNGRPILLVDNFDSFTFNLAYDLEALGCDVEVFRNDVPLAFLIKRAGSQGAAFVLSPGPGVPAAAGVCPELVRSAAGQFGVLGICLGHQVIVEAFGGMVAGAVEVVHGRASAVHCRPHPAFAGVGQRLMVARYHSLAAQRVPNALEVLASTDDGTVMAVAHRNARVLGLQFHPESILTTHGRSLLANALDWVAPEERADARAI